MTDHTISYASFTRRVAGNRVRERFELLVEESPQGYTLIRQLHEESYGSPFPVRTEKSYYSLADALEDFDATVGHLTSEGTYRLQELSPSRTLPTGERAAAY